MAAGDLIFGAPAPTSNDLIFGAAADGAALARAAADVTALSAAVVAQVLGCKVAAGVTGLTVAAEVHPEFSREVLVAATVTGLGVAVLADPHLDLPDWLAAGVGAGWRDGAASAAPGAVAWREADASAGAAKLDWAAAEEAQQPASASWAPGTVLDGAAGPVPWRTGSPAPAGTAQLWRDGAGVAGLPGAVPWHDGLPLPLALRSAWRSTALLVQPLGTAWRAGAAAPRLARVEWSDGAAWLRVDSLPWHPASGLESHGSEFPAVEPPTPVDPCYTPSGELIFSAAGPDNNELIFVCEAHGGPAATVVVPIREVYAVLNSFTLTRVDTGQVLHPISARLSLDVDSWTWDWSASLPSDEAGLVDHDPDGTPVELEAVLNGTAYRLLAESQGTDRQFGRSAVTVSGRGIGAELDSLIGSYDNSAAARTVAQLMGDVLTVNGVGVGWSVDFGLEDWLVPAGIWARQGTAVDALQALAAAGGGYLQPHPTARTLRVLPRYPAAPWAWSGLTPDVELPTAAVVRESISWTEKPRYTGVYVSGESAGVICHVKRAGTDGLAMAPMVTDPLILTEAAARQRGLPVLADTGRQATVQLSCPVYTETGLILPGKTLRYVDGATARIGVVRALDVQIDLPAVTQTLELETHA